MAPMWHAWRLLLAAFLSLSLARVGDVAGSQVSVRRCDYVAESLALCRMDTVCRLNMFLDGDTTGAGDDGELADPRLFAYLLDKHVLGDSRSPERREALITVLETTGNLCNSSVVRTIWLATMSQTYLCGSNEYFDAERGCTCRTGKACGALESKGTWEDDLLSINVVVIFVMIVVLWSVMAEIAKRRVQMKTVAETFRRLLLLETSIACTLDGQGGWSGGGGGICYGPPYAIHTHDPYHHQQRHDLSHSQIVYQYHAQGIGADVGGALQQHHQEQQQQQQQYPRSSPEPGHGSRQPSAQQQKITTPPKRPEVDGFTFMHKTAQKIHAYSALVEGREEAGRIVHPTMAQRGLATPRERIGPQQPQGGGGAGLNVSPQILANIRTLPLKF